MPTKERFHTKYPGVFFIKGTSVTFGKPEKIYYIYYRKDGKQIEEKAGREFQDSMTAAQAAQIRSDRLRGKAPSNEERRQQARTKKLVESNRWTFDRLFQEYRSRKPFSKSMKIDEGRYIKYLSPEFGNKTPLELNQFHVDRLRITLLKQKKPQTVKHVLSLLLRLSNFAFKKDIADPIPFHVELPPVDNKKTEDLSPVQLSNLLVAIDQEPDIQIANIFRLILFTGMRRGEILRLKWKDLDFERGFIWIADPKGGISQNIPMNDQARNLLENHMRTASEYVFPDSSGNMRTQITREANRIRDRAGLPKDFRACHGLRHFFASTLASSGQVDMYTLQRLLTHKSPVMSQRYAHLRDESLKKASNLISDIITHSISSKKQKSGIVS